MTDEQLREAVARLYEDKWGVRDFGLADAAIALLRPVYRSQALEDVIKMLAGREHLIGAVQFRHIAAAIRALSTP